jgi:hypothetical protein
MQLHSCFYSPHKGLKRRETLAFPDEFNDGAPDDNSIRCVSSALGIFRGPDAESDEHGIFLC